jgi:hypothetical protein
MALRIAVFMKDEGVPASSPPFITVIVFEKTDGLWNEINRYYVNLPTDMHIESLRIEIRKTLDLLGDCRVAAGSAMSGVFFRELDSRGFSIFETASFSPETLDGILEDISDELQSLETTQNIPTKPIETETPGIYQLDLVRLQGVYPEMTSKLALRDFLESTPFYELKLICAHLPPWLEGGPYDISWETAGETLLATIRKKHCNGG